MKYFFSLFIFSAMISCHSKEENKSIGTIERLDPALDAVISTGAKAEIIADGFEWSEGPLWIEKDSMLLFSDVPTNTIYKWTAAKGKEIYLKPSGYTDSIPSICKEPGSNGLVLDSGGNLVLCQHGDRRMARMDATLDKPSAKFITIADKYNGKRLSSPNDAVYNLGELFFTDPPYGLSTQDDKDPKKEIPFNGVYRVTKDGQVTVITDFLSRPNGLAFFPGGRRLLVANCDFNKPNWYLFDVNPGDTIFQPKLFFSLAGYDKKLKGLPDGLKIDRNGNVFATGPGGLYILNSEGKLLGKLKLENPASNCALSRDEKTLYITNDMYVLRLKMRD
jgi:gluconolactonase